MIINLTPHAINIVSEDLDVIQTFEPSGNVARVATTTEIIGEVDGVPLSTTVFGEVEGLPQQEDGVFYIVSGLVRSAQPREDLLVPGLQVRNDQGQVVGCRTLDR